MRKLVLILPVVLLATGCSFLFKPRHDGGMGNTTFSNMSWGNSSTTTFVPSLM